ncbi:carboxymuconolactone decarboxylase family protein [Sphingomonas azotifigens]|uniref:carboxymuconolactone decarboxylase family protein n=1 Tax=Sphingomonas azotifigens TaxID=330920 RepID=UPI0009FDB3C6|nr:carboxymuconolactone decarboxylase family protein [Sphingomonas azotifigens]
MTDYRASGLATFTAMLGEEIAQRLASQADAGGFLSGSSALALDFAFGGVWSRPGLEMKQRSLIVIAILIATRQYSELKNHVRIGIRNGLTAREIEEALIQCVPYLGFPAVASAQGPVIEVLRELGLDPSVQTPEERGVL